MTIPPEERRRRDAAAARRRRAATPPDQLAAARLEADRRYRETHRAQRQQWDRERRERDGDLLNARRRVDR